MAAGYQRSTLRTKSRERLSRLETKAFSVFESDLNKAAKLLIESKQTFSVSKRYDIFLSHSFEDARDVLEVKIDLERRGLNVFVDWIEKPEVDRSKVTRENADMIRSAMDASKSLVYLISENAVSSSWVQWELGYADGKKGLVAILPLEEDTPKNNYFYKQEYLGLYPYIDQSFEHMFVNYNGDYRSIQRWLNGAKL